jgi:hypothetical protein
MPLEASDERQLMYSRVRLPRWCDVGTTQCGRRFVPKRNSGHCTTSHNCATHRDPKVKLPGRRHQVAIQNHHSRVNRLTTIVEIDSLPSVHQGPFDRVLVAQAMFEGITLLTTDSLLALCPGPIRIV